MNLLTKGSLNHLTHQLKKTPAEHFKEVGEVIALARKNGIECNVYLEDWSNGISILSTFNSVNNNCAIVSFSDAENDTPLVCSPSRSVVSIISIYRFPLPTFLTVDAVSSKMVCMSLID